MAPTAGEAATLELLAEMRYLDTMVGTSAAVTNAEVETHSTLARNAVRELGEERAGVLRADPLTRHLFLGLAHVEASPEIWPEEYALVFEYQRFAAMGNGLPEPERAATAASLKRRLFGMSLARALLVRAHYGNRRLFSAEPLAAWDDAGAPAE